MKNQQNRIELVTRPGPEQVSQLQKLQAMTNDPSLSQQDVLQVQEYIMHQIVSTPSVDAAGTCSFLTIPQFSRDHATLQAFAHAMNSASLKGSQLYPTTTLQSKMNDRLSLHRFWPCYENRLIKKIQTATHHICVNY